MIRCRFPVNKQDCQLTTCYFNKKSTPYLLKTTLILYITKTNIMPYSKLYQNSLATLRYCITDTARYALPPCCYCFCFASAPFPSRVMAHVEYLSGTKLKGQKRKIWIKAFDYRLSPLSISFVLMFLVVPQTYQNGGPRPLPRKGRRRQCQQIKMAVPASHHLFSV